MDTSCAARLRALLTFARLLVELGQHDVAQDAYERLAREHADGPLAAPAREWLSKLDESAS